MFLFTSILYDLSRRTQPQISLTRLIEDSAAATIRQVNMVYIFS